jgi:hypothetical protein
VNSANVRDWVSEWVEDQLDDGKGAE